MKFTPTDKTASDKQTLIESLDNQRAIAVWRLEGLDDEAATRPMVPSGTNLLGLVKHLAWTDLYWFVEVFAGDRVDYPYPDDDPAADFRPELGDTVADVIDLYRAHVERCNRVIAGSDLDMVSKGDQNGVHFSLRWIMVHMITETARHLGHMDIVREQIDGVTGYAPTP